MLVKSLVLVAAGAIVSAALVVACSDDSPGNADAAVCDCPTVETIVDMRPAQVVPAGQNTLAIANCPAGSVLLGGGCELADSDLHLYAAGFRETTGNPPKYECRWINTAVGAKTVDVKAWATCQVP